MATCTPHVQHSPPAGGLIGKEPYRSKIEFGEEPTEEMKQDFKQAALELRLLPKNVGMPKEVRDCATLSTLSATTCLSCVAANVWCICLSRPHLTYAMGGSAWVVQ